MATSTAAPDISAALAADFRFLAGISAEADDREAHLRAFRAVRAMSEALAAPLSAEDQQVQSMDDVSPTKWHLAHVSWFFETFLLGPHLSGYEAFHPRFGYIFNSYYEAIGPRHARPRRGLLTRPPLSEVMAYRAHVDEAIERLIGDVGSAVWKTLAPLLTLGLHHEQQHQELLLTDIKHVLASQPLAPAYRDDLAGPPAGPEKGPADGAPRWAEIAGGTHAIGHGGDGFCFDNETPCHQVLVDDFRLATRPVTNADVLDFIDDGGYRTATLWLADGWAWVEGGGANLEGAEAPLYWRARDGAWLEFTLGGERPVDRAAPAAHLSYYEADAIAHWMGARLPTEAEWEVAARATGPADEGAANLLAAGYLHPVGPGARTAARAGGAGHAPKGASASLLGLFGDTWEWTASAYAPYPGFKPAAGAVGEYNGKFMVNQMVLRGGSCATPPGHLRPTYRNFFYPHQTWQFSGARLAAAP